MAEAATIDATKTDANAGAGDGGAAARAAAAAAINAGKPGAAADAGKGAGAGDAAARDAAAQATAKAAADAAKTGDQAKTDAKGTAAQAGLEETLLSDQPTKGPDAKAADEAAQAAAKAAAGKPTDYTLEVPTAKNAKGEEVKLLAPEYVKERETFFKASGLTSEQAKAMISSDIAQLRRFASQLRDDTMRHPELGGEHLDQTLKTTQAVLQAHFTPEQRKAISSSAFANHWVLHKLAQLAARAEPSEDSSPRSAGATKPAPSFAEAMWPHLFNGKG